MAAGTAEADPEADVSEQRPVGVPESFDVHTLVHQRRGANPPELGEEESTVLHHAHLAFEDL